MKICFVGLGTMGAPMAGRLIERGFAVAGWDASADAGAELQGRRASLQAAAEGAEIIWTMLPEGRHVAEVHAAVRSMSGGKPLVLADSSTIDVPTTGSLARQAEEVGFGFVDAPVSGGAEGARAGNLSFMVGGEADDIETITPALKAMGSKIKRFGAAGSGQAAKACHNMICGVTALAVCEAFALADALGLDQQTFFELCAGAAAQSWILENRCPVPGLAPHGASFERLCARVRRAPHGERLRIGASRRRSERSGHTFRG